MGHEHERRLSASNTPHLPEASPGRLSCSRRLRRPFDVAERHEKSRAERPNRPNCSPMNANDWPARSPCSSFRFARTSSPFEVPLASFTRVHCGNRRKLECKWVIGRGENHGGFKSTSSNETTGRSPVYLLVVEEIGGVAGITIVGGRSTRTSEGVGRLLTSERAARDPPIRAERTGRAADCVPRRTSNSADRLSNSSDFSTIIDRLHSLLFLVRPSRPLVCRREKGGPPCSPQPINTPHWLTVRHRVFSAFETAAAAEGSPSRKRSTARRSPFFPEF